jgi:acetyltransferase-like isoleucine patch superfamily enzyme
MKNKIFRFIDRIFLYDSLLFYIFILIDRIMFFSFYKYYYKHKFGFYGKNVRWGKHGARLTIPKNIRISNAEKIFIYDNVQIDEYCYIQSHHNGEGLILKEGTRINSFSHIQAFSKIIICENVLIALFAHINSGNHGYSELNQPIMFQEYQKAGEIFIGRGCWIGRNAHILGGAFINNNSVVAANAVVTKKFDEENIILAGVPAKIVRRLKHE